MVRSILLGSTALLALAGAALAADLPTAAPPPAPYIAPPPSFTWTGFYIGVNGGLAGDKFTYPFALSEGRVNDDAIQPAAINNNSITGSASINSSGFLGGGQIGYNYQMGAIVLGLEADIDAADIDGKVSLNAGSGNESIGISAGSSIDYLGTVRGRLGWAFLPRAMIYATGGYAYGGIKSSINFSEGGEGDSLSKRSNGSGYVVGGGMEYAITDHWTFKAEYLYADLGKSTLASGDFENLSYNLKVQTKLNIVRAGINYKF